MWPLLVFSHFLLPWLSLAGFPILVTTHSCHSAILAGTIGALAVLLVSPSVPGTVSSGPTTPFLLLLSALEDKGSAMERLPWCPWGQWRLELRWGSYRSERRSSSFKREPVQRSSQAPLNASRIHCCVRAEATLSWAVTGNDHIQRGCQVLTGPPSQASLVPGLPVGLTKIFQGLNCCVLSWQGSLACCSPWGHKGVDTTEQRNWTVLLWGSSYLILLPSLSPFKGLEGYCDLKALPASHCFFLSAFSVISSRKSLTLRTPSWFLPPGGPELMPLVRKSVWEIPHVTFQLLAERGKWLRAGWSTVPCPEPLAPESMAWAASEVGKAAGPWFLCLPRSPLSWGPGLLLTICHWLLFAPVPPPAPCRFLFLFFLTVGVWQGRNWLQDRLFIWQTYFCMKSYLY